MNLVHTIVGGELKVSIKRCNRDQAEDLLTVFRAEVEDANKEAMKTKPHKFKTKYGGMCDTCGLSHGMGPH